MRMVTEKSGTVWTKGLRARECLGELATTKRMGASKERVTTIEEPAKTRRPQEDQDRWRFGGEARMGEDLGSTRVAGYLRKPTKEDWKAAMGDDRAWPCLGLRPGTRMDREQGSPGEGNAREQGATENQVNLPVNSGNGYKGTRHVLGNGRISDEV